MPSGTQTPLPAPCGSVGHAAQRNHGNSVGGFSATASAGVCAFGSRNQLQQLLRIIQPLLELWSQGLRRDLRGDTHIAGQRIGSYKLYFIDLDRAALLARAESFFDLLGNILGFRSGNSEGAHQADEVFLSHVFGEVQAG